MLCPYNIYSPVKANWYKAPIHVILSEAKNLKFLPESLPSPQSGPIPKHFWWQSVSC